MYSRFCGNRCENAERIPNAVAELIEDEGKLNSKALTKQLQAFIDME